MARLLLDRYGPTHTQARVVHDWLLRLERFRYAPAGTNPGLPRLVTLQREFNQNSWPT
jgi:hypothetical protein